MKFSAWLIHCALAIVLCAGLNGCMPPGQGQLDDEKEPHFIEGKRALNRYDYSGAIDEFEKAVEANPRNASAHFELGWLYEKPDLEPDPAAAIYHYQQFLKLRPTADTAEAVKQRIMNCKQDLAKAVLPLPSSPGVQHDLEQLIQENKQLHTEVDQWRAYYQAQTNRQAQAVTQQPQQQPLQATQTQVVQVPLTQPVHSNPPPANFDHVSHFSPRTAGAHAYVVQPGDTLAAISRKFNVKLDSLAAANPGLNAKKLRVGQTVNVP
jgi:LysM repeat protein